MRRMLGVVMVLTTILVAVSGGSVKWQGSVLSQPAFMIEVNCQNSQGCFSLLGEAVKQAPAGAIIRIAPGLYYEKPLTIDKSLRIEGISTETGHYPRVVLVDVGTAIMIQASVELQRLSIEALAYDPFKVEGSMGIEVLAQTPEDVRVILKEVSIRSYTGLSIGGNQPRGLIVEVVDTTILAAWAGISMGGGHLIMRNSELRGPALSSLITPFHGIILQPPPFFQGRGYLDREPYRKL